MKIFIKFIVLTFFIVSISACGRMGELEKVKHSLVTPVTAYIA